MGIHHTPTGRVLGRRINHDPRSRDYPAFAAATKPKTTYWTSSALTLDQGQIGSCTGNAMVDFLNTDVARLHQARQITASEESARDAAANPSANLPYLDEGDALRLYSEATRLDSQRGSYPPDDTGSDGNSVAKAARNEGFITSWRHSLGGVTQLVQVLQATPVIAGTMWTDSMEAPIANGRIRPVGTSEGGHEYLIAGVDVTNLRIWIRNSWGDEWGVPAPWAGATGRGYAWIGFADFDRLLSAQGDVTVPVIA